MFACGYKSPCGLLLVESDGEFLIRLCFLGTNEDKEIEDIKNSNLNIFKQVKSWLDVYFSGKVPQFKPKYKIVGVTNFQKIVLSEVEKIPYASVTSYGEIAKRVALKLGIKRMSAQAIGGAVKKNPLCIVIPCHRVVGLNGKLVGFAGGLENKLKLLQLEKVK